MTSGVFTMPDWKGWNESEVRQTPTMAGFTPINASARPAGSAHSGIGNAEAAHHVSQPQAKSLVSVSLGRGESEPTPPAVTQALHGPGTKKTGGKSKKRASKSTTSSRSKRRKSSEISDSMPVTKAEAKGKGTAKQPSKGSKTKSKRKEVVADVDENVAPEAINATSVPVFAQPTSMDSVRSMPQTTSLDAVRAAPSHEYTLYNSAQAANAPPSGVDSTQPWLNAAAHATLATPGSNTKRRRPSAAQPPRLSRLEEEDEFDTLVASLPDQVAQKPSKGKHLPKQLPTAANFDPALSSARKQPARKVQKVLAQPIDQDVIDLDDSDDEAMAHLAEAVEESVTRREPTLPPRNAKQNMRAVDEQEDYGGGLLSEAEKQLLNGLRVTVKEETSKPIVRKPFPVQILDRSPIFGATNGTVLRTCFRIGEVLNVGCQAVRTSKNVLLELYARVIFSSREEKPVRRQHFLLKDLYHDNPPHVNGTFDLWDQSRLWDLDSEAFLVPRKEGITCRVIARMRRDGQKWRLEIFSIWEASREDVEYVAGIYEKAGEVSLLAMTDVRTASPS